MPGARTACPSCGASARPGATFCGQCYADFRPAPAPAPAPPSAPMTPTPTAAYGTAASDPLTAPLLDVVLPASAVPAQAAPEGAPAAPAKPAKPAGWPCSRCEHLNPFTEMVCTVCAAPFLAKVAEETKVKLQLPFVGDLSRYGRGQRAAIALGAIAALLVPLALITLLLTKAPPKDSTPAPPSSTGTTSDNHVTNTGESG